MTLWHLRSNKKPTSGRLKANTKKKRRFIGSEFLQPKVGEQKSKVTRGLGGNLKFRLLSAQFAIVSDSKGKAQKTKILSVISNPSNPNYVRRNIITKGAVIKTELGDATVTSRPGQGSTVSAVLLK